MTLKGEARKEYARRHYAENKDKYAESLKASRQNRKEKLNELKSGPCMDCNIKYPPYVMDWDHVSGEKVERVSRMVRGWSWQAVLNEIAKCELVCSNCHRIRTWNRTEGLV